MRRWLAVGAVLAGGVVGLPSTAEADVPRGGTIVEGQGIAGAKLGDTLAAVRAVYGLEGSCAPDLATRQGFTDACRWSVTGSAVEFGRPTEYVKVRFGTIPAGTNRRGKVVYRVGAREIDTNSPGFATTKGIAVGASFTTLGLAYDPALRDCGTPVCLPGGASNGVGGLTKFWFSKYTTLIVSDLNRISVE